MATEPNNILGTASQVGVKGGSVSMLLRGGGEKSGDMSQAPSGTTGTVRRLINILWILMIAGMLVELIYGLISRGWNNSFVVWAWLASLAAASSGGFLGLLFGLPSLSLARPALSVDVPVVRSPTATSSTTANGGEATRVAATNAADEGASSPRTSWGELPYGESTSLEQIADWLTKIIIGLTLTQYDSWSAKFDRLAGALTIQLLGSPSGCGFGNVEDIMRNCPGQTIIPGGSILVFFSVLGFLLAYMWMRRYFIIEMIVGRQVALKAMAARLQTIDAEQQSIAEKALSQTAAAKQTRLEADAKISETTLSAAREIGVAQTQQGPAAMGLTPVTAGDRILQEATTFIPQNSNATASLERIISNVPAEPHPDDPWLGRFGGAAERNDTVLTGIVKALPGSQFCEVMLEVRALTSNRQMDVAGTTAVFFLHPTFGKAVRSVAFGIDGRAPLQLFAYGAFTVGVLLQDGTTLELNLATLPGIPDIFRSR